MSDAGRTIMCTVCMYDVLVFEIPVQFIDPALYVCEECDGSRDFQERPQLEIARGEYRNYDPEISLVPY